MFDFSELEKILNAIETNKSFESFDEHKSRLKEKNLSYDELLSYAAACSAWGDVIEYENEGLKKIQSALDKMLSWKGDLLDKQKTAIVEITKMGELQVLASSTAKFLEGNIAGRDAQKRIMAKKGALAKIASDPKQKEKSFVRECWQDWQKNPDSYKSKAAFGKDMLQKCEHLDSQKKIEDWCREWEKTNPAG